MGIGLKKSIIGLICISILMLAFTNCTKGFSSDAPNPSAEAPPPTLPAPETPPKDLEIPTPAVDAWDAPVGDLIQGATLKDGWYDLRELPAPVNIPGGWTDSAAISNDGLSLYFSYSRYSFAQMVDDNLYNATGAARVGMTGNHFKMFRADLTVTGWDVKFLPFNRDPGTHESSQSANLAQNLIAFVRWSPSNIPSLYFSQKGTNGIWSEPLALPTSIFGTQCGNDNPFIVGDLSSTVDIYFESDRSDLACTGTQVRKHIYHTRYTAASDSYSSVTRVIGINGTDPNDDDTQFYITADGKHAYWTAIRPGQYAVFTADVVGGAFVNARPAIVPNFIAPHTGKLTFVGEANLVELPQGYLLYMMCGIATKETGETHGVQLKICRAKKDKYSPEVKKINAAGGWSDSPFISRDGNRLYFMYSRWNFLPWIFSNGASPPLLTGPDRPGLRKALANPFDESDIYMSTKKNDGSWSEPVNIGISGDYGDSSGMEINNGNTFVWLHGDGLSNKIVMSNKNSDGTWSAPIDFGVGINMPGVTQDNPHISPDGNALWFISSRAGGQGNKDIWFSSKNNGVWSAPVNTGPTFNSAEDDDQFFTPPTSMDLYWNGPLGIMHCVSNGTTCSAVPTLLVIQGCLYPAEVSLPDDLQTMYFGCGSTNGIKIVYSKKNPNGTWGPAVPVD